MSDPIEDLEALRNEGIAVNPLPASEVRRRGTRMRRRNNAIAAVGALAVVAVVATPLAVVARGGDHATHLPPATQSTQSWRQTIPANSSDFDVTALPATATFRYDVRFDSVVDDITLCGVPSFSTRSKDPVARAVDTIGATYGEPGTDGNSGRTVALYRDDQVAAKALAALQHGVETCPVDDNGRGAQLVYDVVDTQLPADDSLVYTQQAQMDKDLLADLTVFQVARVGNALYLATDHTSAGGPQVVDSEVRRLAEWSAPVLSDLCVFAAEPCSSSGDSAVSASPAVSGIGQGAVSAIPADFPLDANLADPEGSLDGPSAKAEGVPALDLCGASAWPADHTVERLALTAAVPQYTERRELVTFSSTQDATAALTRVRDAAQGCPEIAGDTSADDRMVDLQDVEAADLGGPDDSVTFTVTYRAGTGGGIYQFARLGRAVYGTYVDSEFARDSVARAIPALSGKTKSIVARMCPWTETGC